MTTTVIPPAVAAHVLWHLTGTGDGYPAGSFTALLLTAWEYADNANSARLANGWPEYGAAIDLIRSPDGIRRLQAIATT